MNEEENGDQLLTPVKKAAELSEDEFKKKILLWFKERGLLSNMRTYLRHQMITYLRETEIGDALEAAPKTYSAKVRAVHLLIGEFLLLSRHYYSISVLISEIPFLNIFPDLATIKHDQKVQFRFEKQDFFDILHALGITKKSYEEQQLEKLYFRSNGCSLLIILLHVLIKKMLVCFSDPSLDTSAEKVEANSNTIACRWNKGVHNILNKSLTKGSNIYAVRDRLVRFFLIEFERLREEIGIKFQEETQKSKEKFRNEIKLKQLEWKQEQLNMEKEFNNELNEYKNLIIEREHTIKKLCVQVKEARNEMKNLIELQEKLKQETAAKKQYKTCAQILKKDCMKLINSLKEKQTNLDNQEQAIKDLKIEIERLNEDYNTKMADRDEEIDRLKLLRTKLNEKIQIDKDTAVEKEKLYQQQVHENQHLQGELNEMKLKNEQLEKRLQELNVRLEQFKGEIDDVLPLTGSTSEREYIGGAGERHKQASKKVDYRTYRRSREFKRARHRKNASSESSSSCSPVSDILNAARLRLHNLETATNLIEENYKQCCIQSIFDSDSVDPIKQTQQENPSENLFKTFQKLTDHRNFFFDNSNISPEPVRTTKISNRIENGDVTKIEKNTSILFLNKDSKMLNDHNNLFSDNFTVGDLATANQTENDGITKIEKNTSKLCTIKDSQLKNENEENKTSEIEEISPYFQNVQSNIISSLSEFENNVIEVTRDLQTLVANSTKLSEDLKQSTSNEILRQKSNLLLKLTELKNDTVLEDFSVEPAINLEITEQTSVENFLDALQDIDDETVTISSVFQKELSSIQVPSNDELKLEISDDSISDMLIGTKLEQQKRDHSKTLTSVFTRGHQTDQNTAKLQNENTFGSLVTSIERERSNLEENTLEPCTGNKDTDTTKKKSRPELIVSDKISEQKTENSENASDVTACPINNDLILHKENSNSTNDYSRCKNQSPVSSHSNSPANSLLEDSKRNDTEMTPVDGILEEIECNNQLVVSFHSEIFASENIIESIQENIPEVNIVATNIIRQAVERIEESSSDSEVLTRSSKNSDKNSASILKELQESIEILQSTQNSPKSPQLSSKSDSPMSTCLDGTKSDDFWN